MLPDYPDLKRALLRVFAHETKAAASADPMLAGIKHHVLHEGRRVELVRDDGSRQEILFDKPVHGETTLEADAIRREGDAASGKALTEIAGQLQEGMAKQFISTIERATEEAGTAMDAKGQRLSPEHVLEMYDKMLLSFEDDGKWIPPTLVVHPMLGPRARAVFDQIDNDPALTARREAIIDRQRREWRVREASRKLVD